MRRPAKAADEHGAAMAGHERVFVGLGANLGDAAATVQAALVQLAALPATSLVAASGLYRSAPIDATGPDYINAVAELRSELEPGALLAQLQALELRFGRERPYRHAPRTLDLDLLFYAQRRVASAALTLPHPRARQRAFVLAPLADLAPDWPLDGGFTVVQALAALHEQRIERIA
jgi:2-amino-4-hydroxy-6-hydroxymethyldihydropteridine diphosphokinase